MTIRFASVPNKRAIVDRRALADALRASPDAAASLLKRALAEGRAEIARRLEGQPYAGTEAASAYAFLTDQVVRLAYDHAVAALPPPPRARDRLLLLAVGGYGRGEMALHSDVDIAFVTPGKPGRWAGQAVEAVLYLLWDLGLKLGPSTRSADELIALAASDHTVRTALLEARWLWGDEPLFDEVQARFWKEVVAGQAKSFVGEKLEERNARHRRMGDSRYVVEPNVKEGKGGLRDLHTLFWIGKYAYQVRSVADLVGVGLLSETELRQFQRAERFLWAVRCHLHIVAGRAEERLTFDYQREIAARMRYADRPGKSPVERFMRHYFLHAKTVGDLTGVFLAHLDEKFAKKGGRFGLPTIRRRPSRLEGFVLDRGRLALPRDDFFRDDPARLLQIFALADLYGLEIHPLAMRSAARDAKLVDEVRDDPRANALFLDVLTSPRDPETVLRWMNEAGVFGRFVPDFGRVVAQMQFDMYHHYTVDEHSIRAIGLLSRIEKGELKEDHPLSTALFRHIASRRVLYVAVLLHDIAKGRGGDHSQLGAEVARALCPRLGLTDAETETVAWLVRWHLLMSATAFKRDLADPQTIQDFVSRVKSLERLRLLLILTVVDIRAVGPGVWNGWKRQLLRDLFDSAEEELRLGHKQRRRTERIAATQAELAARLGWEDARFARHAWRLPDSYWLAEPFDVLAKNAALIDASDRAPATARPLAASVEEERGATLLSVYAKDRPGLFYHLSAAISLAGANIIDARIHTTLDGMAVDNFLVQDAKGKPFADRHQLKRLEESVLRAVEGQEPAMERLEARALPLLRAEAFAIQPAVFVDNEASSRYTVVEVNARDRAALLGGLARALYESKAAIHSAHIATYGERAVDVFYLTDLNGARIDNPARLKALQSALLKAAAGSDLRTATGSRTKRAGSPAEAGR
jgi:[protein-PII] uridylyltransferase